MIARLLLAAAAVLGTNGQMRTAADAPMQASGPWTANFQDAMCILSRPYGSGDASMTLGFFSLPGQDDIEIALSIPSQEATPRASGLGKLTLIPSGQNVAFHYTGYRAPPGRRQVRFNVPLKDIGNLEIASTLSVKLDGGPPLVFALEAMAHARKAVESCEDDIARKWGFDPVSLRSLTERPTPIIGRDWVTNDDYPTSALRAHASGTVRIWLRIGVDGKATDCGVAASSGNAALDDATCPIMRKNVRFHPAKGTDGAPTPAVWVGRFNWTIPR